MKKDMIVEKFPGTITIHDNVSIYSKEKKNHNTDLLDLMAVAAKNGLVFNSSKCKMKIPSITFYGYPFTYTGIKPDASKI